MINITELFHSKMDLIKLKTELSLAESQLSTFKAKKTANSATRTRAHLLQVKKLCDQLRREILAEAKSLKANKQDTNKQETVKAVPETVSEPVAEPVAEPTPEPEAKPKKTRKPRKNPKKA